MRLASTTLGGLVSLRSNSGVLLRDAAEQKPLVAEALAADPEWQRYVDGELKRRTEIEDVTQWECGRPTSTEMGDMGSDGDDFQVSLRFF